MSNLIINANLKPWQYDFIHSKAQFPGLFAAWGTGKTMAGIFALLRECQLHPGNVCAVLRKEGVNLDRSTIQDFRQYTGDFCNMDYNEQKRRLRIPKWNATIWFLHADERATIQNITLGAVLFEQGDEIDDDGSTFDFVEGRCRKRGASNKIYCIANATDTNHWIYRYWKQNEKKDSRFKHWEATSFDNAVNLPAETLQSWRLLETRNPAIYRRFVMNEWGIGDDQFVLITTQALVALKDVALTTQAGKLPRRIISCDPSLGGDECPAHVIEDGKIIDTEIYHDKDLMVIAGHLLHLGAKHKINNYAIDTIGIGQGIASRLNEQGKHVQFINSAEGSGDVTCYNRRAEMWWYVSQEILRRRIPYPEDTELRRQLSAVRYKVLNSNGLIQLEPKEKTKARLGCSPDRADAFIYGIWGMQNVPKPEKDAEAYRFRETDKPRSFMAV